MSFLFDQVQGSRIGQADPTIDRGEFYGTAFSEGAHNSSFASLYKIGEYMAAGEVDQYNPLVPKEQANHYMQQLGLDLKFDEDTPQDRLNLLSSRKLKEQDRQRIIQAGIEQDQGTVRAVGTFGTEFLGSTLNPVDLPLMFVPIVGNAAKIGEASTVLTRGLVTAERLNELGIGMKGYTAMMINASVGSAMLELPRMVSNWQDQTPYGAKDFFGALAAGAAFGGVIHTGILGLHAIRGTLNSRLQSAAALNERLSPETRENMATDSMGEFLRGEEMDPSKYLDLDRSVVDAKTLSESVRQVEQNDVLFRERYGKLSPKQKELYEFNQGNKLVDNNGLPVIVYHGRTWEGGSFDEAFLGKNTGADSAREGFFFSGGIKTAQSYIIKSKWQNNPTVNALLDQMHEVQTEIGKNPHSSNEVLKNKFSELKQKVQDITGSDDVFKNGGNVGAFMVAMKNPKIVDFEGQFHRPETYSSILKEAKAAGHDGVVIQNTFDGGPMDDIYVAFDKNQIRTAYEYRNVKDSHTILAGQRKAVEDFKAREEMKAKMKEQLREQTIKDGITIPEEQVKAEQFRDVPSEAEIARLDEEIALMQHVNDESMAQMQGITHQKSWIEVDTSVPLSERNAGRAAFNKLYTIGEWKSFLPEGETFRTREIADAISNNLAPEFREAMEQLLKLDPTLGDVRVTFDRDLMNKHGASGLYNGKNDRIILSAETSPKTAVHEMVHASTVRRWRQDLHDNGMLRITTARGEDYIAGLKAYAAKTENKPLKGLVDSYIKAIEHHENVIDGDTFASEVVNSGTEMFFGELNEPHYGLYNFDEFIAEGLSDRKFQLFLNEIPGKQGKTQFREFVDKIRDFFKLKETDTTSLLDDVITDFKEFTETGIRNPDEFIKALQKASSKDVNKNMLDRAINCLL